MAKRARISVKHPIIDLHDFARILVDQQRIRPEAHPHISIWGRHQTIAVIIVDPKVAAEIDGRQALAKRPATIGITSRRAIGSRVKLMLCGDIALIGMNVDIRMGATGLTATRRGIAGCVGRGCA